MGVHNSQWLILPSWELGGRLDWCHPTVNWALRRLTTISHRPHDCCADNSRRVRSCSQMWHISSYRCSHSLLFHFSRACAQSHPLSQVSGSNHRHHNRTSASGGSGLFGSTICQTCGTHGNWAPDKSLKAYYSTRRPLCVLKSHRLWLLQMSICVCAG